MKPETYVFEDDGTIPNNNLPLLLYRKVIQETGDAAAKWFEERFAENNWKSSWRNGVFDYHHYHSNTHEVLGVYQGEAELQLGGEKGQKMKVFAGDVIVIPAGVAHKNLGSKNFGVVGAYPEGRSHDINTGKEGERPGADKNISAVPVPEADPIQGKNSGLAAIWKK